MAALIFIFCHTESDVLEQRSLPYVISVQYLPPVDGTSEYSPSIHSCPESFTFEAQSSMLKCAWVALFSRRLVPWPTGDHAYFLSDPTQP